MDKLLRDLNLFNINGYCYERELGEGKASTTLLYKNTSGDRVVVKMLIVPRNNTELEDFKIEAEILKQLNKQAIFFPKIIFDLAKYDDYPIYMYIMEYIDGITLHEYINDNHLPWSWEISVKMLLRIAATLAQGRFVHRDLHFGNILIVNSVEYDQYGMYIDPGIRILDFGCHKDMFKEILDNWYEDKFRHPGAISTWSPEFIMNPASVDQKHDSWALGVIFYRFLTGSLPIYADKKTFGELLMKYMNELIDWEKINELDAPLAIKLLSKNLLSFNPDNRLSANEICYLCYDIFHTNLLEIDENELKMYIKNGACLAYCGRCNHLIKRYDTRCPSCGTVIDPWDTIPFLDKKEKV